MLHVSGHLLWKGIYSSHKSSNYDWLYVHIFIGFKGFVDVATKVTNVFCLLFFHHIEESAPVSALEIKEMNSFY